jgi:hypothetical protein
MACKPWLGAVVAPTKPPANNPAMPDISFKLEYVFGFRTYECRNNLYLIEFLFLDSLMRMGSYVTC